MIIIAPFISLVPIFHPFRAIQLQSSSQPIWIKFCTHLLLYGIHLWADLNRVRRVGGSRPNKNDYVFFVIRVLVTHPKSYIETTDRRILAANRQSGGEDGCYREKFRNFAAWAEQVQKQYLFAFFGYPSTILRTETVLPQTNGTDGKPRLRRCAFF